MKKGAGRDMISRSVWVAIAVLVVAGAGPEPGAAPPSAPAATVTQPSPEMIARARRFLTAMGIFKSSSALADVLEKFYEPRLFAIVKVAPADMAAARNVLGDVTKDLAHSRLETTVVPLASYFADHFKKQDVDDTTAFLSTPLGQQMLHPNVDDSKSRQELGRYVLQHPQLFQIVGASSTVSLKEASLASSVSQETRQAQVMQQFCDRLKSARIMQTGCAN